MTSNRNEHLYKRFGITLDVDKVRIGFIRFTRNLLNDELGVLTHPDSYKESSELYKLQRDILKEACRQMFMDINKYDYWDGGFKRFCDNVFEGDFYTILVNFQILLNLVYKQKFISYEFEKFIKELDRYLNDFPILGVTIKVYKSKPPQIIPTTSQPFDKEVKDTLGILDSSDEYKAVLENYEAGLKELLIANNKQQLKDVIEDMYTACDTLVQTISGIKSSGLRSLFTGKTPVDLGFNLWQKKIFDEMRNWMDKIKHGAEKEFTRKDIEMLVLLVSLFIQNAVKNRKTSQS